MPNVSIVEKEEHFEINLRNNGNKLASKYLLSILNKRSRRTMEVGLKSFVDFYSPSANFELDDFPWEKVSIHTLNNYKSGMLDKNLSFTTINSYLSAIRGIIKTGWLEEVISTDQYMRASSVKNISGDRLPVGREISEEEKNTLFAKLTRENTLAACRDKVMFGFAIYAGMRRSELVSIDMENINLQSRDVIITGKGNKQRIMSINSILYDYLLEFVETVRGQHNGPLFTRILKSDEITNERLTSQSVYYRFAYWCKEAGIQRIAPHDCRRTVATKLLDKEVPLSDVQLFLGHSNPKTTQRYDMRDIRKQKGTAELLV